VPIAIPQSPVLVDVDDRVFAPSDPIPVRNGVFIQAGQRVDVKACGELHAVLLQAMEQMEGITRRMRPDTALATIDVGLEWLDCCPVKRATIPHERVLELRLSKRAHVVEEPIRGLSKAFQIATGPKVVKEHGIFPIKTGAARANAALKFARARGNRELVQAVNLDAFYRRRITLFHRHENEGLLLGVGPKDHAMLEQTV